MAPSPMYNPYLNFAPTFKYGGREWGVNDMDAFKKLLKKQGRSYDRWARNHATAARVFDPTEQSIYGTVAPQISAIEYERKQRAAYNSRRMADLAGFTQAIMGMLGEISPAIRGAYGEGAETMQAGGTGYGAVLNADTGANAAQGNSLLEVLGSPQHLEGGDAGSVLAGAAGWVPSQMLQAQGNAYADAAATLPKDASFAAQMEMRNLLADAQDEDAEFGNSILDIIKGVPAMRQDAEQRALETQMAKQEFKLKQLEADRDFWVQQQALLIQQGKLKLAAQAEKRAQQAQQRLNYESAGRDWQGNLMPGYTEHNGLIVPPGFIVDKNGNVVRPKTGSGGKGGATLTPGQKADAIKTIDANEDKIKASVAAALKAEFSESPTGPYKNERQRRRKVASKVFQEFKYLATFPAGKKRLRAIIIAALKSGATGEGTGSIWD